jgi:hypothetical protein
MTARRRTTLAAYARAVESAWSTLLERPVVLSPRDFEHVRRWHARGIPLAVIRGALEALAAERRPRRKPRGLHALAAAIEEEWTALTQGRTAPNAADAPGAGSPAMRQAPLAAWRRAATAPGTAPPLRALLERLIEAAAAGARASDLDRELDAALPGVVAPEVVHAVAAELDRDLGPWRDRLPATELRRTRRRGTVERLRRRLGLPALAGPQGAS